MRVRVAMALATALALTGAHAHADDKQVCADAYEKSQSLRDDGRLLKSRDELRTCARAECPETIAKTCAEWLSAIEQRIPSIVLSAKSGAGADAIDVRVSMDGAELATKLDGRAVDVDPGAHLFVFDGPDGRIEQQFVVRQGTKDQAIAITFPRPPPTRTDTPPIVAEPAASPPRGGTSMLRYAGYAAGGAGVIGLGLGTVFGLQASAKFSDSKKDPTGAGCDANDFCGPTGKQARGDAQGAATVSTIGFVVGGVLLASGIALVIFAPSDAKPASAKITPMVGANGGGMLLGGAF